MAWKPKLTEEHHKIANEHWKEHAVNKYKARELDIPRPYVWQDMAYNFLQYAPEQILDLVEEYSSRDTALMEAVSRANKGFGMIRKAVQEDNEEESFRLALFLGKLFDRWTARYEKNSYFDSTARTAYVIRPCGFPRASDKEAKLYEEPGSWTKQAEEHTKQLTKRTNSGNIPLL